MTDIVEFIKAVDLVVPGFAAEGLRERLCDEGTLLINLMSLPGLGKDYAPFK